MTSDIMFTTSEVAQYLNLKRQQVVYYIKSGYLQAIKKQNRYLIKKECLKSFKEAYYFKDMNLKNRGVKTLTEEAYALLKEIIPALEDNSISFNNFIKKFSNIHILPHSDLYIQFKRDNCIKEDKKKGMTVKEIAKKYGLSEIRVYEILKKEAEYI